METKCFEFTVQILLPPPGAPRGGGNLAPPRFISVYALVGS